MKNYSYIPKCVCAKKITFDLKNGKLHNISFVGGCNGNLKAIGKLLENSDAQNAINILKGNECGNKGTSCADQLAIAIENALKELQN